MGESNMEQHQILVYSYAKLILAPLYKSLQTNYNEKYAKKFIDAMTNQIFPALGIQ